ncbi:MAG TPA: ATP-binding protein [Longimicrobium sp.]|jgi:signal transduction histidine kinase|uniref:sensor histidine kinase n=1 Tax=Longimicrobium sp. TaxID=2029185 RepID=UPI002ED9BC47
MLHDPQEERLFPRFSEAEIALLANYGERVRFAPGETLFRQGDTDYDFFVLLSGETRVTKMAAGDELLLTVHHAGEFSGELSILSGSPAIATATTTGEVEAIRIPRDRLRQLVVSCQPVAEVILPALVGRRQEVDSQMQQQEKLAALGRMAAGLAHELNNPAAAVRRAAAQLDDTVAQAQVASLRLHAHPLEPEQLALLESLHGESRAFCVAALPMTPLQRSAHEDEVSDWLDDHGIAEGWNLAEVLVAGGVTPRRLDQVAETMGEARLEDTVRWLASTQASATLLREVVQSADRISFLVHSIKQYSHMDQAPELKEVDLHTGLESTLTLLQHKLKHGVEVERQYDDALPRVCVYPGELNQVWTNLIDNAVDAMQGKGHLRIRTWVDGDQAQVEIADDGPGIPPDIQRKIWEPFFTTKGVGEGSGLGLDIARKVIQRRHGGAIRVDSRPGETRFLISLPLAGPPKQAAAPAAQSTSEVDEEAGSTPGT